MLKQYLSDSQKDINRDWSLKEWHNPVRGDVIVDDEHNLFIVTNIEGIGESRLLWLDGIDGNIAYEAVSAKLFSISTLEQKRKFYLEYKKNLGWIKGRVFTIEGKDYPLLLQDLEYDTMRHRMLYLFLDINTPERKLFKTHKENLIEFVPEHLYELLFSSFTEDSSSSLRYKALFSIEDKGQEYHEKGWSVSGSSWDFGEIEIANAEIDKIKSRLQIRRVCSVLSKTKRENKTEFCLNEDGEIYIGVHERVSGQPGVFNSRVAAALALHILGEEKIKKALSNEIDTYLM